MKNYNGRFKAQKASGASNVPAGGYVGKVISAKIAEYSWGDRLEIAFDIAEGEHAGFFDKQFKANTANDKKWKGVCRINLPAEDAEEWQYRGINNFLYSIEESNNGFTFDFENLATAKGKMCGFIFNRREWELDDGRTGWTTECRTTATVEEIRNGDFRIPKDRPLKNKPAQQNNGFEEIDDAGDELPF